VSRVSKFLITNYLEKALFFLGKVFYVCFVTTYCCYSSQNFFTNMLSIEHRAFLCFSLVLSLNYWIRIFSYCLALSFYWILHMGILARIWVLACCPTEPLDELCLQCTFICDFQSPKVGNSMCSIWLSKSVYLFSALTFWPVESILSEVMLFSLALDVLRELVRMVWIRKFSLCS